MLAFTVNTSNPEDRAECPVCDRLKVDISFDFDQPMPWSRQDEWDGYHEKLAGEMEELLHLLATHTLPPSVRESLELATREKARSITSGRSTGSLKVDSEILHIWSTKTIHRDWVSNWPSPDFYKFRMQKKVYGQMVSRFRQINFYLVARMEYL